MGNLTVPEKISTAWRTGTVARVPILTGTTAQEGRALVFRNITADTLNRINMPSPVVMPALRERIRGLYWSLLGMKAEFDILATVYTDLYGTV